MTQDGPVTRLPAGPAGPPEGTMDADGYVFVTGRLNELIIKG